MDHWYPAYVGIGSNLSEPTQQVNNAIERLGRIADTRLLLRSSQYRSAPFGGIEQPDFVNAAAGVLTKLDALSLLSELQAIEREFGRIRDGERWGPRIIDLDLLVYSSQVIDEQDLSVPHPGIAERNFVLLPLSEIAPHLVIPALGHLGSIEGPQEPEISRIDERV